MRLAGPPPTSPEQGLSLWKVELAQGCFCALRNSEQGCEHPPAIPASPERRRDQSSCQTPKSGKGALGLTPIQMFFSLTKHFNRSLLRIFLHRLSAAS